MSHSSSSGCGTGVGTATESSGSVGSIVIGALAGDEMFPARSYARTSIVVGDDSS